MAEVTRVRHNETGAEWEAPTDALRAWTALGWEPITGDSRTRDDADLERIQELEAQAAHITDVEVLVTAPEPPTVAVVLEEVGDDPAAAQVALDAEQARPNPRTTLLAGLNKIIDAAAGGQNEEDNTHG